MHRLDVASSGNSKVAEQDEVALRQFLAEIDQGAARPHLITGKLAERSLRELLAELTANPKLNYTIQVMPITVAALMPPKWIATRLQIPDDATHLIIPGYCNGDLSPIRQACSIPVLVGPRDLRDLPEWLSGRTIPITLDDYDIQIIAEINSCPRLTTSQIRQMAAELVADGADLIDLGCEPGLHWTRIGEVVSELKGEGFRVSVDSFDVKEIEAACRAGAELVLSVNSTNRDAARDWGKEVVAIPDQPQDIKSLYETIEYLIKCSVPFRIDPILEPIGIGLANSFQRYWQVRKDWPDLPMMMGIGNLSELTDVDSAGINMLVIGLCQELGIRSVLTTQVINWARSSVAECDVARRLAFRAVKLGTPAKRVSDQLVMLRDPRLVAFRVNELDRLAEQIKDHNLRIFAEEGELHILGCGRHWRGTDPFELLRALQAELHPPLDPSHAFYLGFELAKAKMALHLGKQYVQDQPLRWGHLGPGP
ncbi:MAG TPA: DUF6513 domain-containing protein [Pirellulaceae bacterium]|nr:DUF6513 domain-containing protein [Pirellulaceae bacterium]